MILHVDMDAFYASVEQMDRPDLAGKPVVVGGSSRRGVVSAASYEARRFGVRSAMPIFMARQKCPQAVFMPVRMARYKEVSRQVMALLKSFSPLVEQVSIDEAYLDASGLTRLYGGPEDLARELKRRVREEVGLTCSVGVAPGKFLAKVASDMDKPDGLFIITPEEAPAFTAALSVEKAPGVGKRTGEKLREMGVRTLGDVCRYTPERLTEKFGKFGARLLELALCRDASPVTPDQPVKSISAERTLEFDTRSRDELEQRALAHSQDVGRQLRRHGLKARTVTLKITWSDFTQTTRSHTLGAPVSATDAIFQAAKELLAGLTLQKGVRLIGVGSANLVPENHPVQQGLFSPERPEKETAREKADRAVDAVEARFGTGAVKRAAVVKPPRDKPVVGEKVNGQKKGGS